jgi:hypothetical protein
VNKFTKEDIHDLALEIGDGLENGDGYIFDHLKLERFAAELLNRRAPEAGQQFDFAVQCQCGWKGKASQLNWGGTPGYAFWRCPDCNKEFESFPKLPETQAQAEPVAERIPRFRMDMEPDSFGVYHQYLRADENGELIRWSDFELIYTHPQQPAEPQEPAAEQCLVSRDVMDRLSKVMGHPALEFSLISIEDALIDFAVRRLEENQQIPGSQYPIGVFCGIRHTPSGSREFWGYLDEGIKIPPYKCALYLQPQRPAVPDDATIQRALDAPVANGETVLWNIVFGLNNDSEEVRAIMAGEIIRTALIAAAPGMGE